MKFIEITHPEGGRLLINIDHITSAHYRPVTGEGKSRLGFDLDERQNDVVIYGAEAEEMWRLLQGLKLGG